jgi:hypothetical protein
MDSDGRTHAHIYHTLHSALIGVVDALDMLCKMRL